jgi:hypothetical protein
MSFFVAALSITSGALASEGPAGVVNCANLIYADAKTSVCYSPQFLMEISRVTHVTAHPQFISVKLESREMYEHPFAVMTGEGHFSLTEPQRTNLRNYLVNGGFVVASAGCSSEKWAESFRSEIAKVFPDVKLTRIDPSHPIFHTVYDIRALDLRKSSGQASLEGLIIDGKIVLIFSEDGLNDTANAGGNCCCCGGNEIGNARMINVNLLTYALTH